MAFFVDLFYAVLLIWTWVLLLKYRRNVKWWTGNFYWAEHYLWRGSTYFVIIMMWLLLVFLGILYPFGWVEYLFWDPESIKLQIKK